MLQRLRMWRLKWVSSEGVGKGESECSKCKLWKCERVTWGFFLHDAIVMLRSQRLKKPVHNVQSDPLLGRIWRLLTGRMGKGGSCPCTTYACFLVIKLEITGCWSKAVLIGRVETWCIFRKAFYLLCRLGNLLYPIKNPWHPRWEMKVIGKLYCSIYHSCPSGMIKMQRVHIPHSQPLGIDTIYVVQSSSRSLHPSNHPF